jgi:hypothetical protein
MTFAQALARIEELTRGAHSEYDELGDLLITHAEDIVQLGKVAKEMREELAYNTEDLGKTLTNGMLAYDKLMKGDCQ